MREKLERKTYWGSAKSGEISFHWVEGMECGREQRIGQWYFLPIRCWCNNAHCIRGSDLIWEVVAILRCCSPVPIRNAEGGRSLLITCLRIVRELGRDILDNAVENLLCWSKRLSQNTAGDAFTSNSARYGRCHGPKRIEEWVQYPCHPPRFSPATPPQGR